MNTWVSSSSHFIPILTSNLNDLVEGYTFVADHDDVDYVIKLAADKSCKNLIRKKSSTSGSGRGLVLQNFACL